MAMAELLGRINDRVIPCPNSDACDLVPVISCLGPRVLALSNRTPVLVCLFSPEFPEVLQLSTVQGRSLPPMSSE